MNTTLQQIAILCQARGFSQDELNSRELSVSARGQGNGTDCIPDPSVIRHAKDLRTELRQRFPDQVKVTADTCDEWVHLHITLRKDLQPV